ncbi:uncharacterized protein LOC119391236 [Rhipicephalus sanguineus]|uniref:uncharacterized protein LOC119391236 n=1 Tax=Rhipicephalus sanguineus TaxID=34632 RepID=UPI00189374EB|nr:uncharacterized protein LOC119391236 [Rhipicephalus sanguineus]
MFSATKDQSASSRGTAQVSTSSNDYRIVLPRLPTGKLVADSVFLHADLAGRPYRAQDFRDALRNIIDLADITSIGQFQMSHVWMVTCRTALSKVKIVTCGEFFVRGRRCVVIDPEPTEVKMKLLWLPERLEDIYVHEAFQPFGKIKSISAETWRVSEMEQMRTLNRDVVLALGDGVRVSDIPHLLSVCGLQSLVLIPGRPPLCLRCNKVGHIRRHCRTPRCDDCRRFGHTAEECVATYANKLRHRMRPPEDAFPEHIMDATEVLDATGDLPCAAVAEPCAVDKDAASDCAGAEKSKQASNTVDATDSGEKEAVPAHESVLTQKESPSSNADVETPREKLTSADVRESVDVSISKRPASSNPETSEESDSAVGPRQSRRRRSSKHAGKCRRSRSRRPGGGNGEHSRAPSPPDRRMQL